MDFLKGRIDEIRVTEKTYSGDGEAEAMQRQINQYMGRMVTKEQLEKLKKQSGEIAGTEERAKEIEKTVEEQKEAAELDEQMLALMQLVDGITVSDGKISCRNEFIKMFAVKGEKSQNFGISVPAISKKMKEYLDNTPRH